MKPEISDTGFPLVQERGQSNHQNAIAPKFDPLSFGENRLRGTLETRE